MPQISILGCGWLGFPLAESFIETGFTVKGSTTSTEKIALLQNAGIIPYRIKLGVNQIDGDVSSFLNDSEILVVDIPPGLRSANNESFVRKIELLLPFIEKSSVKKVLFISSTSVYGDSDSNVIDEDSVLNPQTESGRQLVEVEKMLLSSSSFESTILRFGGLIGKNRHPVFHLAGRTDIENPDSPINLIHLEDCISIIHSIIHKSTSSEIFNAVAPFHPSRKEYYSQKAIELELEPLTFKPENQTVGKVILSEKIQSVLNYNFKRIENL